MPPSDSLRRLGGGRWETRDGRFTIEPQSGTWVIVDNEQVDELGLPLVRGPFRSLTAAKEAIEAARTGRPAASPLAERLEQVRSSATVMAKAPAGPAASEARWASPAPDAGSTGAKPAKTAKPQPPPEPRWLRELGPSDQRRARDLIARLARMGVDDPERIVRAEVTDGQPALARLAIERALAKSLARSRDSRASAVRAAIMSVVGGADVELGVTWRLVDADGRRIDKVDVPD